MRYKIICEEKPENFESEVNKWLGEGWELVGGHQMAKDADGYKHFSQALIFDSSKITPTQNMF